MAKKVDKIEEIKRPSIAKQIVKMFGFFFGVYVFVVILESLIFYNTLGPFVEIAGVNCGFKSEKLCKEALNSKWSEYQNSTITIGAESYLAKDLINSFNVDKTYNNALSAQQSGYLMLKPLFWQNYSASIILNNEAISKLLLLQFDTVSVVPVDAQITFNGEVGVTPEINGTALLLPNSKEEIAKSLSEFHSNISLKIKILTPNITKEEAERMIVRAENVTSTSLILKSTRGDFAIDPVALKSWVKIMPTNAKSVLYPIKYFPEEEETGYTFFDEDKISEWLKSVVASKTDQAAVNGQLNITNGKATVFVASKTGYIVDIEDAVKKIQETASQDTVNREIVLKIDVQEPEVREGNLNDLGITELISTGWSNFAGSPTNRIHNVKNGASKFNGVLIKPDETFSFNTTLGEVEASTGYLPELVILDDKTIPQYGGGLCQVSTTAFRAALNAGLPILERTAHAYPVSYYKPYGTDATIYLPKPDLVFKNDTGHYVLIQTRVVGTKLYFDFYGTKAARTVKFSGNESGTGAVDIIENVTPYIYDQGLRGKNSFTAVFYRHIFDSTGKLTDNDRFTSKYDSPDDYPH
jgi:vancomycin resistance protein YoaR